MNEASACVLQAGDIQLFSSGLDWITHIIAVGVIYLKREEVAKFVKSESAYKADAYVTRFTLHSELVVNKEHGHLSQTHFGVESQVILVREDERVSQGIGRDALDAGLNGKLMIAFFDIVMSDHVHYTFQMQRIIDFRAVSQVSETWDKFWDSNIERDCGLSGPGGACTG